VAPFLFAGVKLLSDLDGERAEALLAEQMEHGVKGGKMAVQFWEFECSRDRNGKIKNEPTTTNDVIAQAEVHEANKGNLTHTIGLYLRRSLGEFAV
jgi:hypothetical protein